MHRCFNRLAVAVAVTSTFMFTLVGGCMDPDTTPPAADALLSPVPISESRGGDAADDRAPTEWPVRVDTRLGTLVVYQPQPETFTGNALTARAAVSLTQPAATEPVFGTMWFGAHVSTEKAN